MDREGTVLSKGVAFDTHSGLVVATGDTDGDGIAEILATPGIGAEVDVGILKILDPSGVRGELNLRPYLK